MWEKEHCRKNTLVDNGVYGKGTLLKEDALSLMKKWNKQNKMKTVARKKVKWTKDLNFSKNLTSDCQTFCYQATKRKKKMNLEWGIHLHEEFKIKWKENAVKI